VTKQELGEMLAAFKEQIAFLKAELEEARKREEKMNTQVIRLQDGIMNIRAPEAYRDMRLDSREVSVTEEQQKAVDHAMAKRKVQESYIRAMEGEIITSAQDLEDMMNSVLLKGNTVGTKSLHGNTES